MQAHQRWALSLLDFGNILSNYGPKYRTVASQSKMPKVEGIYFTLDGTFFIQYFGICEFTYKVIRTDIFGEYKGVLRSPQVDISKVFSNI